MESRWSLFVRCTAEAWNPGFGDLNPSGMALFVGYVLATVIAAVVVLAGRFPRRSRARERTFWVMATLLLALLAVNKQLDLQVFVTGTGRCIARAEGWYEDRRLLQVEATLVLAVLGLAVILGAIWLLRGTLSRNLIPVIGLILVLTFVMMRVVSFHHLDAFLRTEFLSIRLHRIVEGLALLVVIWGAVRVLLRPAPRPR